MTALATIRRNALHSLIPSLRLHLSEWIERNIRLPEGVSALPGPVRLWPYQREIADAISDPLIERVTLVKPVRVGFTTLLTGAIASFVANEPPVLVLLPTYSDCRNRIIADIGPSSRLGLAAHSGRKRAHMAAFCFVGYFVGRETGLTKRTLRN